MLRVRMQWRDAAFLHWRLSPRDATRLLPPGLEVDAFRGEAWVSAVPFRMARTRLFGIPLAPSFPELNLRTYVRRGGLQGIWFLAIDAEGPFVAMGRSQGMPYRKATLRLRSDGVESVPRAGPPFSAQWQPDEGEADPELDAFLVERYHAFGLRRGRRVRGDVRHAPWPLRPATARVAAWGSLPPVLHGRQPDLAHLSPGVDVAARPARRA